MISNNIQESIRKYSLENPDKEVCGLILVSGNNTFIYKCKNIAQNSKKHFELNPFDYLRALDDGRNKIVGFFHSQKSTLPSPIDIINYQNHKLPSYIYSFQSDEVFEVTDKHLKYNKYLGRTFEIGVNDCFSLVINYYKDEFNINIFNYPRQDGWYEKNPNIIKDNYKKEGFRLLLNNEPLIEGDILEFFNTHFSIYLDGDLLLHHPRGRYSTIEKFDMPWKNKVTNIYRLCKNQVY
mgnify:CR=1 FL=1